MWRVSAFVVAGDGLSAAFTSWRLPASSLSSRRAALTSGARLLIAVACRVAEHGLTGLVLSASPLYLLLATFDLPGLWMETLCLLPFEAGFLPTRPPGKPPVWTLRCSMWGIVP